MSFVYGIIIKLFESFLSFITKLILKKYKQKKEIENDETKAENNAKKIDDAISHEDKVRSGENLLNGQD